MFSTSGSSGHFILEQFDFNQDLVNLQEAMPVVYKGT